LVLTDAGSLFSSLTVSTGSVMAANDSMLGAGPITVNAAGTLRYTGSSWTTRTFNLNSGTLEVTGGSTLSLNGSTVGGGFLRGSGTFALTGNTAIFGSTSLTSTTISQSGLVTLTNFTNGGTLINNAGATLTWNGGLNQSSGNVTVNGTANVSDFTDNGYLNIPAGGVVNNSISNMTFGGGSTTFAVQSPTSAARSISAGSNCLSAADCS